MLLLASRLGRHDWLEPSLIEERTTEQREGKNERTPLDLVVRLRGLVRYLNAPLGDHTIRRQDEGELVATLTCGIHHRCNLGKRPRRGSASMSSTAAAAALFSRALQSFKTRTDRTSGGAVEPIGLLAGALQASRLNRYIAHWRIRQLQ